MSARRFDVEPERAAQQLDSHAGETVETLVRAVAALLELPVAIAARLDEDRALFEACVGVSEDEASALAGVTHSLLREGAFVIHDALDDARVRESAVTRAPLSLRFIAGIALRWPSGALLGALTVADRAPRVFTAAQLSALEALAGQARRGIELRALDAVVRRSNERLEQRSAALGRAAATIESSPDTVLVVDRAGRCQELSSSVAIPWESSRQSSSSLVARPLSSLFGSLGRDLEARALAAIDQRVTGTLERDVEHDGRHRTLLAIVAPCREDEALVIVRDVSCERELARMKDELVSMIAHEIRTPLSAMHASLRLLDARAMGELTPEQSELVAISAQSAERLTRLVNDVLDLEQLSRGPVPLRRAPTDLHALVVAAAREVQPIAADAGVRVEVQSLEGFRASLDGDRVSQAIVALLGRAVRSSPRASVVVLRLDASCPNRARLSVRDQSAGLSEEEQARLFQRFERVDVACGETGLGLAIVRSIVEQHGGELGVESERGCGTTVWLELDAHTPPTHALAARWTEEALSDARREFVAALAALRGTLAEARADAADEGALARARAVAHRIAGTAGTCGFALLSERARQLEERCERGDPRALAQPLDALLGAIDETITAAPR